jgi:hypothetical protein
MISLKRRAVVGVAILATVLVAAIAATSASAAPDPRITPVNTDSSDATGYHTAAVDLAKSIAADASQVTDAQFITTTPPQESFPPNGFSGPTWLHDGENDGPLAIGNDSGGPLADFPTAGSTYGMLTTGDPWFADQANESAKVTRDNGGDAFRGDTDQDVSVLEADVTVPGGANCLALDYRFMSDEFPEFVGSQYNDAFIAEVDSSTWTTSGSTITAPNDFATKTGNAGVSINGVGPVAVSAAESTGTTYDAATGLVTTKTPISPGAHKVYLSIFDQGDQAYDSAAFVDNLRFITETAATCKPPEVAQTAPPAGPPAGPPPPPSNTIVGSSIKFKNGSTVLSVTVPGPGVVTASQATNTAAASRADAAKKKKKKKHKKPVLIKKASVTATAAGVVKLTIRPTSAGKKLLRKKGKFTVNTAITFTPTGGTAKTTFKKVTIKVIKKHRKHHKKH